MHNRLCVSFNIEGIFFDAAMGFMRSSGCPKGTSNCPPNVSKAVTDAIGTEILQRTVRNLAKWGKYPIFNAHYADMSYNGDTTHSEAGIMTAIGSSGGMLRYYDGDAPLSPGLIDNALRERAGNVQVPTVFHTKGKKQKTIDAIAVFMLIRQNFSYFMESNGYYDDAFKWHVAYDYDYGLPVTEPVRTVIGNSSVSGSGSDPGSSFILYSRNYTRCAVSVKCDVAKCRESPGGDLIHNCCEATIQNTSTGLIVGA
jgi:hypothetical protein